MKWPTELSWNVDMDTDAAKLHALFTPSTPQGRELTVRIQGKRIWWKPWRRRPDRVLRFPSVDVERLDGEAGVLRFSISPRVEP